MLKIRDLTEEVLRYHPEADVDIILDAYLYSIKAHRGQSRSSGEAYISHPIEVAYNLAKLKVDERTVAAGLLHDTIEDTLTTPEEITELFGEEIFQLVDGVTKIGMIEFSSREESQAENYRKMILAMAKDIRVVLIKLADRAPQYANPRPPLRRQTKEDCPGDAGYFCAPIANRLGIGWMKNDLENGAFKYVHPEEYRMIEEKVAQGQEEREKYLDLVCKLITKHLGKAGIEGKVKGRPKHFYGIYRKMLDQDISFNEVYDLYGIRVLTTDVKDCYAVLGLIHSLWTPIPGRFRDYVAMPKPNMYQSLHTTVIGPKGERVEVQIRTHEMNRVCEEGIAAHWQYKESDKIKKKPMDPAIGLGPPSTGKPGRPQEPERISARFQGQPVPTRSVRIHSWGRCDLPTSRFMLNRFCLRGTHGYRRPLHDRKDRRQGGASETQTDKRQPGGNYHVQEERPQPRLVDVCQNAEGQKPDQQLYK